MNNYHFYTSKDLKVNLIQSIGAEIVLNFIVIRIRSWTDMGIKVFAFQNVRKSIVSKYQSTKNIYFNNLCYRLFA